MRFIISAEKRSLRCADLEKHRPDIAGLVETWLGDSVLSLEISSYNMVSRRDREKLHTSILNHGGVAL